MSGNFAALTVTRCCCGSPPCSGWTCTLAEAIAPGSYLAVSHATDDHVPAQASAAAQEIYADASAGVIPRTRAQVTRFLDGLDLIEPGVVDITRWHPEIPPARPAGGRPSPIYLYGGVARKGRQS